MSNIRIRGLLRTGITLSCLWSTGATLAQSDCAASLVLHAERLTSHEATISAHEATIADLVGRLREVESALFGKMASAHKGAPREHELSGAQVAGKRSLLTEPSGNPSTQINRNMITTTEIGVKYACIGGMNVTGDFYLQGSFWYQGIRWSPPIPTFAPIPSPTAMPSAYPSTHPSTHPSGHPTPRPTGFPTRQPSPQPTSAVRATIYSAQISGYQTSTMAVNAVAWTDRSYQYTTVPSIPGLVGALLFQGPHDLPVGVSITITSRRNVAKKVYVFAGTGGTNRDAGFSTTMNNINGWTNHGSTAGPKWEGQSMGLYSTTLPALGTVTLPTTSGSTNSNTVGIAVV